MACFGNFRFIWFLVDVNDDTLISLEIVLSALRCLLRNKQWVWEFGIAIHGGTSYIRY